MYKITVIDLDCPEKEPYVEERAVVWDCLSVDDVECVVNDISEYEGDEITLTDEEKKEVGYRLNRFESMPDMDDLRSVVRDILNERE